MQMKYLSLALAAALATTLTACGGSDNKSNYNKDTLTPVSPGTTTPEKEDPQGGKEDPQGGKEDPQGGKEDPKDPTKDPEKEDENKKEEPGENVPNPEDNPGNAAESGDKAKKPSVVGQQYIRGGGSSFDVVNNKEYNANATVVSYVPLQNKPMTNIVVARLADKTRKDAEGNDYLVKYILGENPAINPNPNDDKALQYHNDALVQAELPNGSVASDLNIFSGEFVAQYINTSPKALEDNAKKAAAAGDNDLATRLRNFATAISQITEYHDGSGFSEEIFKKATPAQRISLLADYTDLNQDSWKAGIVTINGTQATNTDADTIYDVDGQERNRVTWLNGVAASVDPNGASTNAGENNVRIYGANSQYIGDKGQGVQAFFNSYTVGPNYLPNQNKLFTNVNGLTPNGTTTTPAVGSITNDPNDVAKMQGLLLSELNPTRFENVQYGRVTGNLTAFTADQLVNKTYVRADFADRPDYTLGTVKAEFDKNNGTTDVYFYRGVGQTALKDMPKEGKYEYRGHALMYGLDNTYSGPKSNGESNSVAFGGNIQGIGNFVQAEFDAAAKDVKGSVYNIWYKQENNPEEAMNANKPYLLERVDLVTFNGKVVGNSIEGTADRTYTPEDDKAAYKGSFYGSNIAEMGGSINSVTSGYADSKWGGVFGAKLVKGVELVQTENNVD